MAKKVIFLVFFLFGAIFAGEGDSLICASTQSSGTLASTIPGGEYITAHGHIHALAIFVQFSDDNWNSTDQF